MLRVPNATRRTVLTCVSITRAQHAPIARLVGGHWQTMSRRRIEAGAQNANTFSLRGMAPAATGATQQAKTSQAIASASVPPASALSFNLDALSTRNVAAAVPVKLEHLCWSQDTLFRGARNDKGRTSSDETMHLGAVIDDLTQRLRKASDARSALEGHIQRINAAFERERRQSGAKIGALASEVSTLQDNELKLRSDLAQKSMAKELDEARFQSSVQAALQVEETNARVADSEAKLLALKKEHASLTEEVRLLKDRKCQATEAARDAAALDAQNQQDAPTREAMDALRAEAVALKVRGRAAFERQAVRCSPTRLDPALQSEIEKHAAAQHEHAQSLLDAEAKLVESRSHVAEMRAREEEAGRRVACMQTEMQAVHDELDSVKLASTTLSFNVDGAMPPVRHEDAMRSLAAQTESQTGVHTGVPFHFAHDAPIDIGARRPDEGTATDAMVQALIADLQLCFNFAANAHASIGKQTTTATGVEM